MRDSQKKKRRDLRRSHRGGHAPRLGRLYDKLHYPEEFQTKRFFWFDWEVWQDYYNDQKEWIRQKTGIATDECWWPMGGVPASFRRSENRSFRAKAKQKLKNLMASGCEEDFEEFFFDRPRRNVRYLYW